MLGMPLQSHELKSQKRFLNRKVTFLALALSFYTTNTQWKVMERFGTGKKTLAKFKGTLKTILTIQTLLKTSSEKSFL